MSNAETFLNMLSELHPDRVIDCLAINDHHRLLVYEGDDSRSYIRVAAGDEETEVLNGFLIKNDHNRSIYLLAVDACFFSSGDQTQRCDCLVFEDSCLCFVELKLNVHRRAADKLNNARRQLGASIQFFKTNILLKMPTKSRYRLEAYAVMREHIYPRNRAARNQVFVSFLEQYGVELFETNTKIFSA